MDISSYLSKELLLYSCLFSAFVGAYLMAVWKERTIDDLINQIKELGPYQREAREYAKVAKRRNKPKK